MPLDPGSRSVREHDAGVRTWRDAAQSVARIALSCAIRGNAGPRWVDARSAAGNPLACRACRGAVRLPSAVRFNDGTEGNVELSDFVHSGSAGIFAALRDATLFAQARIESGAVTWPGGLDLAPDAMHRAIKARGTWIVE